MNFSSDFNFLKWVCREGNGTPLQYSCLENPVDGGSWWAAVHGVARSRTRLSGFTFTFHFHALEKEMATHSSVLACRVPGTGEPGGLPSMGSAQSRTRLKWLSSSSSSSKWVWSFMGNYFHCPKLKYANMLIWGNHLSSLRFTWSKMGNMASSVDKRSFLYKTLCI